jgi:outer membrane lipoprotein carrier protein
MRISRPLVAAAVRIARNALHAASAVLAAGAVLTASAGSAAASPASEVDGYLAGLSSWSADFKQTIDDAQGKVLRSATGHLALQRPGKFRWDYTAPSEQLMLADGSKLWFYDKDLAQANVRDLDATLASTPAMLLASAGSVSSQFDIAALPSAEGLKWFVLKPKRAGSDFQIIKIGFDKGELAAMRLVDKLNEVTQLRFSAQQKNRSFAPDVFTFTPPPGVDVIGRDPKPTP